MSTGAVPGLKLGEGLYMDNVNQNNQEEISGTEKLTNDYPETRYCVLCVE